MNQPSSSLDIAPLADPLAGARVSRVPKTTSPNLVSVVIPCYNAESTILACLQSVINQTYKDLEVLIIDDGSTDNTLAVLQNFIDSSNPAVPIRIISQANSGPSVARNKGIMLSKGSYIAFLDSDDYWFKEKLEKQMQALKQFPEAALVGGRNQDHTSRKNNISVVSFKDLLFSNYFATSSVLLKKEVLGDLTFNEDQRYSEDYLLWLQIAAKAKCLYIKETLIARIIAKREYGETGLAANLRKMEQGELSNYKTLYRKGLISTFQWLFYSGVSLLKYVRRESLTPGPSPKERGRG